MPAAIRCLAAPDAPPATAYAQVVEVAGATRWLFVSGQIPALPDMTVPDAIEDQARLAWANVVAQLRAGDMTLDNLVKVTVILADRSLRSAVNAVSDEIVDGRLLAWTTIVAATVQEDWLLEIEAIAAA